MQLESTVHPETIEKQSPTSTSSALPVGLDRTTLFKHNSSGLPSNVTSTKTPLPENIVLLLLKKNLIQS